jgi:uncharacterized protein with PIN domain
MAFSAAALWEKIAGGAKRVFAYGKQIATLEERITALEKALTQHPADVCDYCGERAMRKISSSRVMGATKGQWRHDVWTCKKCGKSETRSVSF